MISLYRTLRTAVRALRRNVMRSALTCLGIIIGIAAVIAMMEIGNGSSAMMQKAIASMGANTLLVLPGAPTSGGISWGAGGVMTLTADDCDAVLQQCPAIEAGTPIVGVHGQVVYGNRNWSPMSITGSTPAFLDVRDWSLSEGNAFSEQDVRNAAKVCLIGQTLGKQLFGTEDPIGKEIRVKNVGLTVLGVLGPKGANMMGRDQDDIIIAPWTTLKYRISGALAGASGSSAASESSASSTVNSLNNLYPNTQVQLYPAQSAVQAADTPLSVRFANVDQVLVSAKSAQEIPAAIRQITDVLHERHRIHDGDDDDFQVRDMTEMSSMLSQTTRTMTQLLLCVALISLVVGGVGIMNIMLVSVTERTREIGLRMAVGARSRDILWQFLVEAVLLCVAGGILGIAFGRGSSFLVTKFFHWPTQVSVAAVIVAVIVAAGIGIVFGFYPAWKASRLDPIEALRYE